MTFSGPFFKQGRNAKSRRKNKLIVRALCKWAGSSAMCVKCWALADDYAHIRDHAEGYMQPLPQHAVPLCRRCHTLQETDRDFYAPFSVLEAQEKAAHVFNAYEVAQDIGLWVSRLWEMHCELSDEPTQDRLAEG